MVRPVLLARDALPARRAPLGPDVLPVQRVLLEPNARRLASVYATVAPKETASGEDTQPENFTAAHRTLPFGTLVDVDNQENGHWAVVRITDRGPFVSERIIHPSQAAARALGISGLTQVCHTSLG